MSRIKLSIKYSIPLRNEASSICPSAHHPALFLIQAGISDAASAVGTNRIPTRNIPTNIVRLFFSVAFYFAYLSDKFDRCTSLVFRFYYHLNKLLVQGNITRQFRMKRCSKNVALFDRNYLLVEFSQSFHARAGLQYSGSTDKHALK